MQRRGWREKERQENDEEGKWKEGKEGELLITWSEQWPGGVVAARLKLAGSGLGQGEDG